ncbi:MAG TPA: hypothetical protein VF105_11510 [Gemmatimonadaceae bacterium]
MRRRVSVLVVGILVAVAVAIASRYVATGRRGQTRTARDSIAREVDTMCVASRIGLPCDPY